MCNPSIQKGWRYQPLFRSSIESLFVLLYFDQKLQDIYSVIRMCISNCLTTASMDLTKPKLSCQLWTASLNKDSFKVISTSVRLSMKVVCRIIFEYIETKATLSIFFGQWIQIGIFLPCHCQRGKYPCRLMSINGPQQTACLAKGFINEKYWSTEE